MRSFFAGCGSRGRSIVFAHSGAAFAPQIVVSGTPQISWMTSEGDGDATTAPIFSFVGANQRTTSLRVTPWSALRAINIGYDGSDGGAESTVLSEYVNVRAQQSVTSISGLDVVRDHLQSLAMSYNPITALDLSGFSALQRFEAYSAGLVSFLSSGCSAMRRICVENCSITNAYDLSAMQMIEDIRGADNSFPTVLWYDGELPNCWHICIRNQVMPADAFPAIGRLPAIRQYYVEGTGRSGVFDLSNALPAGRGGDIWLQTNNLTGINLTGCEGIVNLTAQNNEMDQAAVDAVLTTIDSFATSGNTINLTGNAVPSATGLAAVSSLEGRGWTVAVAT